MKTQPKFQPGDRAWCADDKDSYGQLEAGHVYYVFAATDQRPQHLRLNNGMPAMVWPADRFDRMRPAHMMK